MVGWGQSGTVVLCLEHVTPCSAVIEFTRRRQARLRRCTDNDAARPLAGAHAARLRRTSTTVHQTFIVLAPGLSRFSRVAPYRARRKSLLHPTALDSRHTIQHTAITRPVPSTRSAIGIRRLFGDTTVNNHAQHSPQRVAATVGAPVSRRIAVQGHCTRTRPPALVCPLSIHGFIDCPAAVYFDHRQLHRRPPPRLPDTPASLSHRLLVSTLCPYLSPAPCPQSYTTSPHPASQNTAHASRKHGRREHRQLCEHHVLRP